MFTFDRAFDVDASQSALFDSAVAPVVDEVLRGYSCTVFAYGQTGTGKTYTMEGTKNEDGSLRADSEEAGIIVRAVRRVFDALTASGCEHHVKISFLEIYNEVRARGVFKPFVKPLRHHSSSPLPVLYPQRSLQRLDDLLGNDTSAFMENSAAPKQPGFNMAKASSSTQGGSSSGTSRMTLSGLLPGATGGGISAATAEVLAEARDRLKIVEDKRAGVRKHGRDAREPTYHALPPHHSFHVTCTTQVRVLNLEEASVKSAEDVFALVARGIAKRATAETACNAQVGY
jgi:hypothetical protein